MFKRHEGEVKKAAHNLEMQAEDMARTNGIDNLFEGMNIRFAPGCSGWADARLSEVFAYLSGN